MHWPSSGVICCLALIAVLCGGHSACCGDRSVTAARVLVGGPGSQSRPGAPAELAAPAPFLRPLEAVAMRPPELDVADRTAQAIGVVEPPRPVVNRSSLLPDLLAGRHRKPIGIVLLGLAGLTAGLALLLSRRGARTEASTEAVEANHLTHTAAKPQTDGLRDVLTPLLQARLAIEIEALPFPPIAQIFGRPIARGCYRVDAGHPVREPHFTRRTSGDASQPVWQETAWMPIRRLDPPYFAAGVTPWDKPLARFDGAAR